MAGGQEGRLETGRAGRQRQHQAPRAAARIESGQAIDDDHLEMEDLICTESAQQHGSGK